MRQEKTHVDDSKKHKGHSRHEGAEVSGLGKKKHKESDNSQRHGGKNSLCLTEIGAEREKETDAYPNGFLLRLTFWTGEPVEFDEALACGDKNEEEKSDFLAKANNQDDDGGAHKAYQYSLENNLDLVRLLENKSVSSDLPG